MWAPPQATAEASNQERSTLLRVTGLTPVVVCGAVSPKAPLGANLCRMQDGDGREELACTEP